MPDDRNDVADAGRVARAHGDAEVETGFGLAGRGFARVAGCPACGGELRGVRCKLVCERCRLLVENCSGD